MQYLISVYTSSLISGSMEVSWHPSSSHTSVSTYQGTNFSTTFSYEPGCRLLLDVPYMRVDKTMLNRALMTTNDTADGDCNGFLQFKIKAKLGGPNSPRIYINVLQRPKNMMVMTPSSSVLRGDGTQARDQWYSMATQGDRNTAVGSNDPTSMMTPVTLGRPLGTNIDYSEFLSGERYSSMREFSQKFGLYQAGTYNAATPITHVPIGCYIPGRSINTNTSFPISWNPANWTSVLFTGVRGRTRFKAISTTARNVVARQVIGGATDEIVWGSATFLGSPFRENTVDHWVGSSTNGIQNISLSGGSEFELPYSAPALFLPATACPNYALNPGYKFGAFIHFERDSSATDSNNTWNLMCAYGPGTAFYTFRRTPTIILTVDVGLEELIEALEPQESPQISAAA